MDDQLLARIARRANYMATRMIHEANHRDDVQDGDPKVGGHPAACASAVHLQTVFHLAVREPADWVAMKPHSSPVDHSLHALLGLFRQPDGEGWMDDEEAKAALFNLRKFPSAGEAVFQSYHAETDPDSWGCFPAGSVGIPPVVAGYAALGFRYAADHGFEVPDDAHFWSVMGDSEFREGSLPEAMPDLAERQVGNLTWIVDYNRQSLDGIRIPNYEGLRGTDDHRLQAMAEANGWEVIQLRHGRRRKKAFKQAGGKALREVLETGFTDYEMQALLYKRDASAIRKHVRQESKSANKLLKSMSDEDVLELFTDLGGHDVREIFEAMMASKKDPVRPTLIIAHTLKGWGLEMAGAPGNHSAQPSEEEVERMREAEGIPGDDPFAFFDEGSSEQALLKKRGKQLRAGFESLWKDADRRREALRAKMRDGLPETIGINLDLLPKVHTQYVWGQLAAKLTRLGNAADAKRHEQAPELSRDDARWASAAAHALTLSPDVGTSTNINPVMDDKVYGPEPEEDYEKTLDAIQRGRPLLNPSTRAWTRHLRFEIAEATAMVATGSLGKMDHMTGVPLLPLMTVYDFFVKRCLDQLYYQLYWGSSFVVVGTPSGVTLAPEGAQHSWKSDIQMPNLITWEPAFGIEVDWILSDAVRRHFEGDNAGRTGVLLRCVTRALPQKLMLEHVRTQPRFQGASKSDILAAIRRDCLAGGWYLVDRRGQTGYVPGENVLNLFVMGALVPEALDACARLERRGVFANVIVVSSPDLLLGNLAHANGYRHLRETLGVNGNLHLTRSQPADRAGLVTAAGARAPVVSVHDGEPGLLDNIGSVVGVQHEALAVRKATKCGRPTDAYRYQGMDAEGIADACWRVLERTAAEDVVVEPGALSEVARTARAGGRP